MENGNSVNSEDLPDEESVLLINRTIPLFAGAVTPKKTKFGCAYPTPPL